MNKFYIKGTRGTLPACGSEFSRYGGHTTCYILETRCGIVVFDAGTGIARIGSDIVSLKKIPQIYLLFTHFHMDHLIGLPCFAPLYYRSSKINIMVPPSLNKNWKTTVGNFMARPYWPVGFGDVAAKMRLTDLKGKKSSTKICGINIRWMNVPHPQNCLSYRIDLPEMSIVIANDIEFNPYNISDQFIDFCKSADHLIFDAQYTPDEYRKHIGWGHSSWETAAILAKKAKVGRLILTHHAPEREDSEVDKIVESTRKLFPATIGATQELVIK